MSNSRYSQVSTGVNLMTIYYAWCCKDCGALVFNGSLALSAHEDFHQALDEAGIIL